MKTLLLTLVLAGAAFAQTAITTYSFTKADCSPLSPLMLFRPPGFVCTPSTTVMVSGSAPSYEVVVEFQRANGMWATERTFLKANEHGQAAWVIYEDGVRVRKVIATPQAAGLPVTEVF